MERIDLTQPYQADPRTSSAFQVSRLVLDWDAATIEIEIRDSGANGLKRVFRYEGAAATSLMVALNKANLSTNSLHKRILSQLISDGKLAGSIAGTPD